MPFIPALQGDVADVLTPLILNALSGVQLGQDLTHIQLSRHVAHQVGPAISWAALAATLEATRRQGGAPSATADRIDRGLVAFFLALQGGPPGEDPAVPAVPAAGDAGERRVADRRLGSLAILHERRAGERRRSAAGTSGLRVVR